MTPHAARHQDVENGHAAGIGVGSRRVLVVEDEFFLAVQIEEWLADGGFQVVDVVHTADEAVAVAVAERPGLVVMDIRLAQDSDGITAAKEIFARTGIRCVFASAYADPPTRQRAEETRPFAWLHKPFTAQAMLKAVNEAFEELEA